MSKTIRVSNGDWDVDERGRFSYIGDGVEGSDGREKVAQDVACTLLQNLYPNSSWGSQLYNIESCRIVDAINAHKALISSLVHDSVDRLIAFQKSDKNIPDTEKIKEYTVSVNKYEQPTSLVAAMSYIYYVQINTVAGDLVKGVPYLVQLEQVRDPSL